MREDDKRETPCEWIERKTKGERKKKKERKEIRRKEIKNVRKEDL